MKQFKIYKYFIILFMFLITAFAVVAGQLTSKEQNENNSSLLNGMPKSNSSEFSKQSSEKELTLAKSLPNQDNEAGDNKANKLLEVIDEYKNKSEITIYDVEELLKISDETKSENDEEEFDFIDMLYSVLGEDVLNNETSNQTDINAPSQNNDVP
ncbi:MAG: hypothetical protein AB7U85_05285 [Alphaproteobacteria bacterium]